MQFTARSPVFLGFFVDYYGCGLAGDSYIFHDFGYSFDDFLLVF